MTEYSDAEKDDQETSDADVLTPIILSLGKEKKKNMRRLKKGKGKLMDEVFDVVEQVQAELGDEAADKIIVPVVVVYREKTNRRKIRGLF